jgi:hypothetical protein
LPALTEEVLPLLNEKKFIPFPCSMMRNCGFYAQFVQKSDAGDVHPIGWVTGYKMRKFEGNYQRISMINGCLISASGNLREILPFLRRRRRC